VARFFSSGLHRARMYSFCRKFIGCSGKENTVIYIQTSKESAVYRAYGYQTEQLVPDRPIFKNEDFILSSSANETDLPGVFSFV
jgi:hypothetical protein